jgi:hypothetical protein
VLTLLAGGSLAAQAPPILPSTRIVQAGPVSLYPVVSLHDVGTDSNVYLDGVAPKEDFTYTLTPRLYAVAPIASARFIGTAKGDFVYYQTYEDQRTVNGFFEGRFDMTQGRVRPFASASFNTYSEQSLEINERLRQSHSALTLGTDVELTAVTSLTGWARREKYSWDAIATYEGVSLSQQLDRTEDSVAAGLRFRLSPFTRIIAEVELQRDRFQHSPEKDADSLRIAPVVEFENGGAITGQAHVGYRAFRPLSPALADYSGLTGSAALRYTFLESTRVSFDAGRDVRYSYEPLQPYYLESGLRLKVTQQIAGPFELIGMAERWQLRYQRLGGADFDGRHEDIRTIGAGLGLLVNPEMEVAVTIDRTERTSSEPSGHNYDRHRVLASVTYGR